MNLNFNLLETNLVNLAIVIGVLFWFLRGFLGGILEPPSLSNSSGPSGC